MIGVKSVYKAIFVVVILVGCNSPRPKRGLNPGEVLRQQFGLNVEGAQLTILENTYDPSDSFLPGGLSDGRLLLVVQLAGAFQGFEGELRENGLWHALPLNDELLDGQYLLEPHWENNQGPFDVRKGFYLFDDRFDKPTSRHAQKAFYDRPSYNISLGVYDSETGKIYIHVEDS